MSTEHRKPQSGFTLIELIMFIVIVSVALTGVLVSLNLSVSHSADPLQPKQALAIAEATLESILLKNYADVTAPAASTPITGYTATATVTTVAGAVGGVDAKKITISVTTPSSGSYTLTGYRMDY